MWYKKEGGFAIVIAALIAISRLYLTVHYPTDVLVSLILGSIYGIISYYIVKFIMKKSEKMRKVFDEGAPYNDRLNFFADDFVYSYRQIIKEMSDLFF